MAKSKYETHVKDKLILIEAWARNGLTDEQIAKNLGIGKTTFYKYLSEHNELSELLKRVIILVCKSLQIGNVLKTANKTAKILAKKFLRLYY